MLRSNVLTLRSLHQRHPGVTGNLITQKYSRSINYIFLGSSIIELNEISMVAGNLTVHKKAVVKVPS